MAAEHGIHGIVVGYDGSEGSLEAVHWAVGAARARRTRLTLFHTWQFFYNGMMLPVSDDLAKAAAALLAAGVTEVRETAPDVEVGSVLEYGSAASMLLELGDAAELLVVGSNGRSAVGELVLGSVSAQVSVHARVPVAVVRGDRDRWTSGPVLVGVDGSPTADAALGHAFHEADLYGAPLSVLCAADRSLTESFTWLPYVTPDAVWQLADDRLTEAIGRWKGRYPSVRVEAELVDAPAVETLLERSARARLVVVGSRGVGSVRGLLLGSVSGAVLRQAPGPVAVVHGP